MLIEEPPSSRATSESSRLWNTALVDDLPAPPQNSGSKIQVAHEDVPTQQRGTDESHPTTSQGREAMQSDDGLPSALVLEPTRGAAEATVGASQCSQ